MIEKGTALVLVVDDEQKDLLEEILSEFKDRPDPNNHNRAVIIQVNDAHRDVREYHDQVIITGKPLESHNTPPWPDGVA